MYIIFYLGSVRNLQWYALNRFGHFRYERERCLQWRLHTLWTVSTTTRPLVGAKQLLPWKLHLPHMDAIGIDFVSIFSAVICRRKKIFCQIMGPTQVSFLLLSQSAKLFADFGNLLVLPALYSFLLFIYIFDFCTHTDKNLRVGLFFYFFNFFFITEWGFASLPESLCDFSQFWK